MSEWWENLTPLNQGFYTAAVCFGVIMIWQLIAALIGLEGDEVDTDVDVDADGGVDIDHDATYDDFEHGAETDAVESTVAFKVLSVRSILAFCTLFSLGSAMYMNNGLSTSSSMGWGTVWGLGAMFMVAGLFYLMRRMQHTGTKSLRTCVGTAGTVYLAIPEDGVGEARVTVSGVVSYVKARGRDGTGFKPNTPIRVRRLLGKTMIEVEEDKGEEPKKEEETKKGDE